MTKKLKFPDDVVMDKIDVIRGQKVMLDRDLAELYGVLPRRLREQVTRNRKRFPAHFMCRLTTKEAQFMVSQNATPSMKQLGGHLPFVFTEHGILMLANVIKSDRAMKMSIRIIEIFVKLREALLTNKDILLKIEQLEKKIGQHDEAIKIIFSCVKEIINPEAGPMRKIGFRRKDELDLVDSHIKKL